MEHRLDLENLLLDGLPEQERRHVVNVMEQVTFEKARRLRELGVVDEDRDLESDAE
jgi:hypothetical protein